MSLADSATPTPTKALTIDVRSRRSERRCVVLASLGAALAIALLPLRPVHTLVLIVTMAAAVLQASRSQGWLDGPNRLTAVSWLSDGRWLLTDATGKNIPATLSADSRVGGRWLWLRWHTEGGGPPRRSMLLLKGDALPVELRRLSVRLRLESGSHPQTQSGCVGA